VRSLHPGSATGDTVHCFRIMEAKLQFREGKVGAEGRRTSEQILLAQVARLDIFSRKQQLPSLGKVRQRVGVDVIRAGAPDHAVDSESAMRLLRRAAKDHAAKAAHCRSAMPQASVLRSRVPQLILRAATCGQRHCGVVWQRGQRNPALQKSTSGLFALRLSLSLAVRDLTSHV